MHLLIDSHCHLTSDKFNRDRDEVIKNLRRDGLEKVITAGTYLPTSRAAVALAEKYENVYATVGVNAGDEVNDSILQELRVLAQSPKVIAIGEIGLDYHHNFAPKDVQKRYFIQQIHLANELDRPIVVHDREANQDTFEIIKAEKAKNDKLRGVLHSYSGDLALAWEYLKLGFYISISGPVTYSSAKKLQEVARYIPLDYLFVETDSPFLTPGPLGKKRNEPLYVKYVAATIAELKGVSFEEVAKKTTANVKRLFNI